MDFRAMVWIALWTFLIGPVLGGSVSFSAPQSAPPAKVAPASPAKPQR